MGRFKVALLMAVVLFTVFAVGAFAEDSMLKITEKVGKVLVRAAGTTEFVEANVGQPLNPKDFIKTGDDGKVLLEFPNKSGFTLKPNTEMSIEELVWDNMAKKVGVNMTVGQMKTLINKLDTPSEFKVKTPSAICGARGTWWVTNVSTTGATEVYVGENAMDFSNPDGTVNYSVTEGNTSSSDENGNMIQPSGASGELVNSMTGGFDVGMTAEPYSEAEGGQGEGYEFEAPEITPEETASRI